ncbi:MAG TPA: VWA domain-containing protein [Pyrinomonadaceae bacterium]|nr:VWA domain-containing protein [Pyrinomonadaceae bacterium]
MKTQLNKLRYIANAHAVNTRQRKQGQQTQVGGMRDWLMHLNKQKLFAPALLIAALAFLSGAASLLIAPLTSAQKIKQLPPPPPPLHYKPKPTPTPEYEVVKITSNLVMVPVSVTNAQGQPVLGLKPSDFRIEEDGRTQEIAQLGDPEQVPLDIAVLIDVSGSVVARFDFEQQAAAAFLKQVLKPEDRATVFAIDESPRMIQKLASAQVASQSIMSLKPSNSYTAFFDSVLAASNYLDQSSTTGRRRIAIVISDGDDTARINDLYNRGNSQFSQMENQLRFIERAQVDTQREVQRAEVTFYSINPSGQTMHLNVRTARSELGMERIAAATGGAAFVPKNETELAGIFNRIASEIRSQYLLQYYSNNQSGSRAYRRIAVSAPAHAELRVRAREGYYPKAK